MKKFLLLLSFIYVFFFSLFLVDNLGFAQTPTPGSQSDDVQKRINEFQQKISELQAQEKTLSSQIGVMDNQINLTTLQIEFTKKEISDLALDIDTTDKKITHIEKSLDELTKVLINRIKATYITGSASSFQILLGSSDVTDFVQRANYLRIAQAHDKRLIYDTVQAKNDYSNQKEIFEDKKKDVETLKKELEEQTARLEQEKKEKDTLLTVTKNDEVVYQQRLQAALAEQRAIQGIASGGGDETLAGDIGEGSTIGRMIYGSSPCSSGTHVHFEVRRDGGLQDPSSFLSNRSINFVNSPDGSFGFGGSWNWPLNDPIYISQAYGMTYWARSGWYGGGPHTGIDMYSSDMSVKAVKSGKLYRGSIACGGGQLLYSKVDHGDGTQSYYLHIVP
ncbi:MAG: hypothetical protein HYV38_03660 [Candidatus Levybacteria bacterium]|nr:hypothetical protein [Candidatus Levybacteria bacterium]MBI2421152.1 hypothetical protein [Candidatus Levybacteria bacterium]